MILIILLIISSLVTFIQGTETSASHGICRRMRALFSAFGNLKKKRKKQMSRNVRLYKKCTPSTRKVQKGGCLQAPGGERGKEFSFKKKERKKEKEKEEKSRHQHAVVCLWDRARMARNQCVCVCSSFVLGCKGFPADLFGFVVILLWGFWVGLHVSAVEVFVCF